MDIYNIISLYRQIKSPRIKLLGILVLHLLRRRYLNMVFDPVLACNLRCKMCYFSDPEARKNLKGVFSEEDILAISKSLFYRVVRLQIGCGAEPTIYKGLPQLVKLAKEQGIPYVSLTTNGQLLTDELLEQVTFNGLNELIISAHGLSKSVYEDMMPNAQYTKFISLLEDIRTSKIRHPNLKLRFNYTVNEDNIDDLKLIPQIFSDTVPDVIQLRPIQQIGDTAYNNFSKKRMIEKYEECIVPVVKFCESNQITCLYPEYGNLKSIDTDNENSHENSFVEMLPYFQLSPFEGWKEKINPYKETFEDYCRRNGRVKQMLRYLFGLSEIQQEDTVTKALNYQIK